MASDKARIIEDIFRRRWDESTLSLATNVVTLREVSEAIELHNKLNPDAQQISTRNPANFAKDFIRNRASANRNWPAFVWDRGFTMRQVTGGGDCFMFVSNAGQDEPFPQSGVGGPGAATPEHHIESVSLPLASRRLGRNDEPWLIQVVTRLRIIETHFSLYSSRRANVRQVDLLQMSVKLARTEIDALFLLQEDSPSGELREVIVTCEAKRGRDDVLEDQILRQAKAPFSIRSVTQDLVVPIAVKCVAPSKIHVIEFGEVSRNNYEATDRLQVVADSLFVIEPPVPGICA